MGTRFATKTTKCIYSREKNTYRKRFEENKALYDTFHGVTGQAERCAQMAPALPDERRDAGRRLGGGCCCRGGRRCGSGRDQRWRLADGRRATTHARDHLADHVVRRPAAAHPHPPLQRLHQYTVGDGNGDKCGGGEDGGTIIRATTVGDGDTTLQPSSCRLPAKNRFAHVRLVFSREHCAPGLG